MDYGLRTRYKRIIGLGTETKMIQAERKTQVLLILYYEGTPKINFGGSKIHNHFFLLLQNLAFKSLEVSKLNKKTDLFF